MIEAQIVCSHQCQIPDLGLKLERGDVVWVAIALAQGSEDLRAERKKGNVRVSQTTRPTRPPAPPRPVPPFVVLQNRSRMRPQAPQSVAPAAPPAAPAAEMDTDAVVSQVRALLAGDIRSIAEEVGRVIAAQQQPVTAPTAGMGMAQIEGALEAVLRRALPLGGASAPGARSVVDSEGPLYMPDVMSSDAKATISVDSSESGGQDALDDAAAALRELKRRRGKTNEGK